MATVDQQELKPMSENRRKSLTALLPEFQTKLILGNIKSGLHTDAGGVHGCFNSILGRKLSCQILWNGKYELETLDGRKFAGLHFEGYYIAPSHPSDVLRVEEQW